MASKRRRFRRVTVRDMDGRRTIAEARLGPILFLGMVTDVRFTDVRYLRPSQVRRLIAACQRWLDEVEG